jgi:hypothetical protein
MARVHGRNARLYVDITGAGAATPITFVKSWSLTFPTDKVDVTALTDTNKVYVAGLPDVSGTVAGFYDDATAQLYTASIDGVARKTYLYPISGNAQYWYGTALWDFTVQGAVDGANEFTASLAAASAWLKVG